MQKRLPVLLAFIAGFVGIVWLIFKPRADVPEPAPKPVAQATSSPHSPASLSEESSSSAPAVTAASQHQTSSTGSGLAAHDEKTVQLVRDIEAAMEAVDDPHREERLNQLIRALLMSDPSAAGYLTQHWEQGSIRAEFLRRLAKTWANLDIQSAVRWANSLSDSEERKTTGVNVCLTVGESDPAAAIKLADSFGLEGYKGTLEELIERWGAKDLNAAMDWARSRPAGETRNALLARLAVLSAKTDPAAAANLIAREIPAGEAQEQAVLNVVHLWAERDPQAASAWVDRFTDADLQNQAKAEIRSATTPQAPASAM